MTSDSGAVLATATVDVANVIDTEHPEGTPDVSDAEVLYFAPWTQFIRSGDVPSLVGDHSSEPLYVFIYEGQLDYGVTGKQAMLVAKKEPALTLTGPCAESWQVPLELGAADMGRTLDLAFLLAVGKWGTPETQAVLARWQAP